MLRHLGLIAVCACIVASVGCDGGPLRPTTPKLPPTTPTLPDPNTIVTVPFGGRVVNADAGGPVANVRVSVSSWSSHGGGSHSTAYAKETATSGGDGTFTLPVTLPRDWKGVHLEFTGPAGYDDTSASFGPTPSCGLTLSQGCWAAADRPAIRMYPTLAIGPGESIDVRVDHTGIVWCGHPLFGETQPEPCRRVLVAASPGDSVELEVVPHDSSKPMALGLTLRPEDQFNDPDMSVRRLMVPPGHVPYVLGTGTARLTARR
jgi:hypothetical protein